MKRENITRSFGPFSVARWGGDELKQLISVNDKMYHMTFYGVRLWYGIWIGFWRMGLKPRS